MWSTVDSNTEMRYARGRVRDDIQCLFQQLELFAWLDFIKKKGGTFRVQYEQGVWGVRTALTPTTEYSQGTPADPLEVGAARSLCLKFAWNSFLPFLFYDLKQRIKR